MNQLISSDHTLAKANLKTFASANDSRTHLKQEWQSIFTSAHSIEQVTLHPWISGYFHLAPIDDNGDVLSLVCHICPRANRKGILIRDKAYSCLESGQNMEQWFSKFKSILQIHLNSHNHNSAMESLLKKEEDFGELTESVKKVQDIWCILSAKNRYLILESSMSAVNCRTAFQCGIEVGNIDHSRVFIPKLLPLIDDLLQENLKEWFCVEFRYIGTILGILLVVYFIGSDGKARLACQIISGCSQIWFTRFESSQKHLAKIRSAAG